MTVTEPSGQREPATEEAWCLLRQAEAAEARFRGLLESAPDATVISDTDGCITLINRQAEQLFGYRRQELVGQPVELLIPERFRGRHVGHRQRYQQTPETRPMGIGLELLGRRKDGSAFPVEISLSFLETDGGRLVTSAVRDISERKRVDEQLRRTADELARSNADLEQFAYVASHDMQEPLRMVASYTQLLARRYRGRLDKDADEFIGFAVDGALRLQHLIDDLLTYSRVGTRARPLAATDVNALFDEVVGDLAAVIDERGAQVTRGNLPTVQADRLQLGQVLRNLVANAIKFSGDGPCRVDILAEPRGSEWLFAVRDNGIGIDPRYAERIFVMFQRLHTQAEYPGTGIGLAICKKVVERHGGRIWVESQPGQGATFLFTLPAPSQTL